MISERNFLIEAIKQSDNDRVETECICLSVLLKVKKNGCKKKEEQVSEEEKKNKTR